jgi:hypothetical protein
VASAARPAHCGWAIARSLIEMDPEMRQPLKKAGLLTRDAREKESKKYGLKKARKAPQSLEALIGFARCSSAPTVSVVSHSPN